MKKHPVINKKQAKHSASI